MIGLWSEDLLWQEMLSQMGVCLSSGSRLGDRAVTVLNREPSELHAQQIWRYVESGGGVLAAAVHAAVFRLVNTGLGARWLDPAMVDHAVDTYRRVTLPAGRAMQASAVRQTGPISGSGV